MTEKSVIILGAGITGLATAYWLKQQGYAVTVLEKNDAPGGSMESVEDGAYLFDRGPNSGLETTPLIGRLVKELGLEQEFVYANPAGNKRYILRNGNLHQLPTSPGAFLTTRLFSTGAKIRLFGEPFIGKSADGYYQSIAQFVRRRLGQEFLDYAINPFVSGVYAGNPEQLSVKSAFPKLYALEEEYGGILVGAVRSIRARKRSAETSKQSAKMFSFRGGMQTFPRAIARKLGAAVKLLCDVTAVEKSAGGWLVKYNNAGQHRELAAAHIISTVPAYTAAKIFRQLDPELANHLDAVYYPPVQVLYVGFEKTTIARPLDGFGFLIPEKEEKPFLGAIWSSVLFPARAPLPVATFTLFIGGARNAAMFDEDKEVVAARALAEFKSIMGIQADPVYQQQRFWSKAIPQYNVGYIEHERYCDSFEQKFPGIILGGNFRGGISVGDCVKNSETLLTKVTGNGVPAAATE